MTQVQDKDVKVGEAVSSPSSNDKDVVNDVSTSCVSDSAEAFQASLAEVCRLLDNQDAPKNSNSASSSSPSVGAFVNSKKEIKKFLDWLLNKYAKSGGYVFNIGTPRPRLTAQGFEILVLPTLPVSCITCPCVAYNLAGYAECCPNCFLKHPKDMWQYVHYVPDFSPTSKSLNSAWYDWAEHLQGICSPGFSYAFNPDTNTFGWCVKNKRVQKWNEFKVPDSRHDLFVKLFNNNLPINKTQEQVSQSAIKQSVKNVISTKLPEIYIKGSKRDEVKREALMLCQREPGWLDCSPSEIKKAILFVRKHSTSPTQYIMELMKDELDGKLVLDHQVFRNYMKSFRNFPSSFLMHPAVRMDYERICKADTANDNPECLLAATAPPAKKVAKVYRDEDAVNDLFGIVSEDSGKENLSPSVSEEEVSGEELSEDEKRADYWSEKAQQINLQAQTSSQSDPDHHDVIGDDDSDNMISETETDADSSSSDTERSDRCPMSDPESNSDDDGPPTEQPPANNIPADSPVDDGLPRIDAANADMFSPFVVWLDSQFMKCDHDNAQFKLSVHSEMDNDVDRPKIVQPNARTDVGKSAPGVYFKLERIVRPSLFNRWWNGGISISEMIRGVDRNYEHLTYSGECHLSWQMFHNVATTIRGSPHDAAQVARQLQGADFGCGLPDNFGSEHLAHVVMSCYSDGPSSSYYVNSGIGTGAALGILGTFLALTLSVLVLVLIFPFHLHWLFSLSNRAYWRSLARGNVLFRWLTFVRDKYEYWTDFRHTSWFDPVKLTRLLNSYSRSYTSMPLHRLFNLNARFIRLLLYLNKSKGWIPYVIAQALWWMHRLIWRTPVLCRIYNLWWFYYSNSKIDIPKWIFLISLPVLIMLWLVACRLLLRLFRFLRSNKYLVDEPSSPFCFITDSVHAGYTNDAFNSWLHGDGGTVVQDAIDKHYEDFTQGRNKLVITNPLELARRACAAYYHYWTGAVPSYVKVYNKFNPLQLLNGFLKRFCAQRPELTEERKAQLKYVVQHDVIANLNCFVRSNFYKTHSVYDFIDLQVHKGVWSLSDIDPLSDEIFYLHNALTSQDYDKVMNIFKKHFKLSVFVKDEIYFKETAPRFITSPNWITRILFGYLFWPIEVAIEESRFGKTHFIKHLNNAERIDKLNHDFAGCQTFVQSDGAAFECCVSEWDLKNIELPIYMQTLLEVDSYYQDLFLAIFNYIHQPHWLYNKNFKIWVDRIIRISGLTNTSTGNGVENYVKSVATYRYGLQIEPDAVVCEGDDCMAGFKRAIAQELKEMNTHGISMTFAVANKWYDLEFCGFKLDENGHVMRDHNQLKAKLFSLFTPQPQSKRLMDIRWKAKLIAYQELYPHVKQLWEDPEVVRFIADLKYISRQTAARYLASHPNERPYLMILADRSNLDLESFVHRL